MTTALQSQRVIKLKLYNRTFFGIPTINVKPKVQSLFPFILNWFNCIMFLAVVKHQNHFYLKQ